MVKTDCFAYENDGCEPYCIARNKLDCRQGDKCFSYKKREEYEKELMRINGTTDMSKILDRYAAGHVEKGESNGR